ncbi:MAG: hypothetical protein AB1330_01880 [Bacillota bacterium]
MKEKLQKGRELFLSQLTGLGTLYGVRSSKPAIWKYTDALKEFQVPEGLEPSFIAYYREFIEEHCEPVRADGAFSDIGNDVIHYAVIDKLASFYGPLINQAAKEFPEVNVCSVYEPWPYSTSLVCFFIDTYKDEKLYLPLVCYFEMVSVSQPFFFAGSNSNFERNRVTPELVYRKLYNIYIDAKTRIATGLVLGAAANA